MAFALAKSLTAVEFALDKRHVIFRRGRHCGKKLICEASNWKDLERCKCVGALSSVVLDRREEEGTGEREASTREAEAATRA